MPAGRVGAGVAGRGRQSVCEASPPIALGGIAGRGVGQAGDGVGDVRRPQRGEQAVGDRSVDRVSPHEVTGELIRASADESLSRDALAIAASGIPPHGGDLGWGLGGVHFGSFRLVGRFLLTGIKVLAP
nr:MAG TPA: hypothetical protein [Caudoviricetes sp.]